MSKTVVALFNDRAASQNAVQALANGGITRDRVDISQGQLANKGNDKNSSEEKDGLSKFFESLFGSDDSERYSNTARTCGSIVTVHATSEDEARKAAEILDNAGAEDIDDLAESCGYPRGASHSGHASGQEHQSMTAGQRSTDRTQEGTHQNGGKSIPVMKEDVHIGKREVETGGVRIRSRIVERPVQENLRLREEHVMVERRKVDRPVTDADRKHFQNRETEIVEHKEVPVVNKNAKVVEEIRVGKEVNERQQTVRDTEKKTEVDVQKIHRQPMEAKNKSDLDKTGRTSSDDKNRTPGSGRTGNKF